MGLGESEFDATSLGKLLNLITENKCCTPILSKTLRGEYATQLENERDRHGQKNISNFWLQSYPVDPLGKFLGQCKEMLLNSMEGDLPETPFERNRRKRIINDNPDQQSQNTVQKGPTPFWKPLDERYHNPECAGDDKECGHK